eukprot:GEZU01010882.1.p1 GENE.GEZU01010882.1~~GEZU01010882.1.p1  ORF type:complete len:132 (-),score=54.58 GEZU01010882.1:103-498(-)
MSYQPTTPYESDKVAFIQPQQQQQQQYYASAPAQPVVYQYGAPPPQQQTKRDEENTAVLLFIIGFFFGLCWIINWVMFRKSTDPAARKWAKISGILFLTGIAICIAVSVMTGIIEIIIVFAATGASRYSTN